MYRLHAHTRHRQSLTLCPFDGRNGSGTYSVLQGKFDGDGDGHGDMRGDGTRKLSFNAFESRY